MILPCDVLFYKGTDVYNKIVSEVEHSPYTHVALATGDGKLIEANLGIKSRKRAIYEGEKFEVHRFNGITDDQRKVMLRVADSMLGDGYDIPKLFRDFIRIEFGVDLSFIDWKKHFICSDMIDIPAHIAGIKRDSDLKIGTATPSELLAIYDLPVVK